MLVLLLALPAFSAPLGFTSLATADVVIDGDVAGDELGGAAWARDDLDGDGIDDLVLGAPGASSYAGAALVFLGSLDGGLVASDADLLVDGAGSDARLGWSVASPGDLDGDGMADLALGAPGADGDEAAAGSAFVWYSLPADSVVEVDEADLRWTGVSAGDEAGVEVCPAGDTDADGSDDLVVSAWYSDDGGTNAGSIYVLLDAPTGSASLSTADGRFDGSNASDWLGYSACGGGDVDGDGYDDIVVGADGMDVGGSNAGGAFMLRGPVTGSSIRPAAFYQAEAGGDYAGHSVSIVGDTDGDGDEDAMIGAFGHRLGAGTWWGAAYMVDGDERFRRNLRGSDWRIYGNEAGGMLGYVVAPAGDVDADGHADVTIGIRYSDTGGTDAGAAMLVYGPLTGRARLGSNAALLVGTDAHDETSWALDGGDLDGDGYSDVVLTAPWHDSGAADAGRVYVVKGGAR